MDDRLIVTASPHIRDNATTRGLMGNVLIALVPSIVASGLIFGMRAILLTAVTTLACVVFEYLYCKLMHKPNPVGDLSACVTGVILALNMPVSMPLWIAIVGALVAIVIIKQLFGGLGYNFANPALVGRIVLFLGFTSRMTAYVYPDMSVDALASATPLNAAVDLHSVSFVDIFLGGFRSRFGCCGDALRFPDDSDDCIFLYARRYEQSKGESKSDLLLFVDYRYLYRSGIDYFYVIRS